MVDKCLRYVYDVKSMDEFYTGVEQVDQYVTLLNLFDVNRGEGAEWTPGGTYEPLPALLLPPAVIVKIYPPDEGVVAYEILDFNWLLAAAGAAQSIGSAIEGAELSFIGLEASFGLAFF